MRQVTISNQDPLLEINHSQIKNLIDLFDQNKKYFLPKGELSIAFVDCETIKKLHKNFLNDDTVTDVITFAGDEIFDLAGEIVICPQYAYDSYKEFNQTFQQELTLYIMHGCLHLCGLDDHLEEDIKEMRQAENFIIDLIEKSNMLLIFKFNKR